MRSGHLIQTCSFSKMPECVRLLQTRRNGALRAVQQHRAYIAPDVPFGWLDEPPSINRLLGLAVLSARGGGAVALASTFNAIVYGQTPTAQQLSVLRESLLSLAQ
jgi:hypothetical protein